MSAHTSTGSEPQRSRRDQRRSVSAVTPSTQPGHLVQGVGRSRPGGDGSAEQVHDVHHVGLQLLAPSSHARGPPTRRCGARPGRRRPGRPATAYHPGSRRPAQTPAPSAAAPRNRCSVGAGPSRPVAAAVGTAAAARRALRPAGATRDDAPPGATPAPRRRRLPAPPRPTPAAVRRATAVTGRPGPRARRSGPSTTARPARSPRPRPGRPDPAACRAGTTTARPRGPGRRRGP